MSLHPLRQKEFFSELSVRSPITIIVGRARRIEQMNRLTPSRYPSWRQVFGLCILTLSGLVIVAAFWGLGSRLSPYHGHAAPSARIPIARSWFGPKGASSPTTSGIRGISYPGHDSLAFIVPISRPSCLNIVTTYIPPVFRHGIAYFDFLIPSRSPPPPHFCLA